MSYHQEPWVVSQILDTDAWGILDNIGRIVISAAPYNDKIVLDHIVDCVNACDWMDDPAKEIPALRYTPLTHKDAQIADLKARIAKLPHADFCLQGPFGIAGGTCTCAKGEK